MSELDLHFNLGDLMQLELVSNDRRQKVRCQGHWISTGSESSRHDAHESRQVDSGSRRSDVYSPDDGRLPALSDLQPPRYAHLPPPTPICIRLPATIRNVHEIPPGTADGNTQYQYGVEFSDLDDRMRLVLIGFVFWHLNERRSG